MKKIAIMLGLIFSLPALAQNARWDLQSTTVQAQGGNLLPVFAIPGANISFLACSSDLPSSCTTPAVTFNGVGTACPSTAQVNPQGSLACTGQSDGAGNFGAFFAVGTYAYTVTTQGRTFGPALFTINSGPVGPTGPLGPAGPAGVGCEPGNCVVTTPSSTQGIDQPANTSFNVNTSGSGTANYNGSQILNVASGCTLINCQPAGQSVLLAPSAAQNVSQPSGTSLTVNSLCSGTGPYDARTCGLAPVTPIVSVGGCNITSGSTTLNCTGVTFTSGMVGDEVYVAGAGGTTSTTLHTTVLTFVNTGSITLASSATSTTTNTSIIVGPDATSALQAAYNFAVANDRSLYIPAGAYLHHGLNFTNGDITIYGDGYQQTQLLAMSVTNPTKIHTATQTGVDISGSQRNRVDNVVFYGGWIENMSDMAPTVNVMLARVTNGFAIEHSFNNDYFFQTGGAVNVFNFGYEQTSFVNCFFEQDSTAAAGNIVLSAVNSLGYQSPYQTFVSTPNSTTKISWSGADTVIAGNGSMVVVDQGTSEATYTIGFHDTYTNMSTAGSGFLFIEGTGAVRGVEMNTVYGEVCDACRLIIDNGPAWFWNITTTQFYTNSGGPLTGTPIIFGMGFLGSNAQVDVEGTSTGVNFTATSCAGSILQLGEENATASCTDYAYLGSTSGGSFNSLTSTPYKANGTSGVSKTCTVLPTVVNGIITGC